MRSKTILIASDLSARSDPALKRGFSHAQELGASVRVASIVDDCVPSDLADDPAEKCRARLEAPAKELAEGAPYEILVDAGDPIACLIDCVNTAEVDLVAVGPIPPAFPFPVLGRSRPTSCAIPQRMC